MNNTKSMYNILISICIPVFNSAGFIRKTLDSVINQTIMSKEIIIVDDGSTDNSADIIKEYSNIYPYIKYIYQENQGVAMARQTAVNNATGKYVGFVDADDIVDVEMYQKMVDVAEENEYDIVECRALQGDKIYNEYASDTFSGREKIKDYFINYDLRRPLWLRIYNHELFNENTFPHKRVNNEDVFVFPCLLAQANKYFIMPEDCIYYYYGDDNEESVVNLMKHNNNSTYKKVVLFAEAPVHFEKLLKASLPDVIESKEFKVFCGRFYIQILTRKYIDNSFEDCMNDIMVASKKDEMEIKSDILEYLSHQNRMGYWVAKILGLKVLRKLSFIANR